MTASTWTWRADEPGAATAAQASVHALGIVVPDELVSSAGLSAAAVDAVLDEVIEGTLTLRQVMRLLKAGIAGKSSGGGTATIKFRDTADAKDRIAATVDTAGNRSSVTVDVT
jgi:hypothetical protein